MRTRPLSLFVGWPLAQRIDARDDVDALHGFLVREIHHMIGAFANESITCRLAQSGSSKLVTYSVFHVQMPKKVSIWFGRTFRTCHSIASPPDFYAIEGLSPGFFAQTACDRRCIDRRKSGRCLRHGAASRAEGVIL
jgi:hypothetical protein